MERSPVAAVVVTYNPVVAAIEQTVAALAPALLGVFVVDNSDPRQAEETERAVLRAGGTYLTAGGNVGIAAAQNHGVREALLREPEAVLLLDDDSRLGAAEVSNLLDFLREQRLLDPAVAAVAPRIVDRRTMEELNPVLEDGRLKLVAVDAVTEAAFLLGSGTLMRADAVERYGHFREEYFIDHVDKEWGYRVRARGGRLLITPAVTLWHELGGDPIVRGKKTVNYVQSNPARHYYMVRNSLLLLRDVRLPVKQQVHEVLTFGKIVARRLLSPHEPIVTKRAVVAGLVQGALGRRTALFVAAGTASPVE